MSVRKFWTGRNEEVDSIRLINATSLWSAKLVYSSQLCLYRLGTVYEIFWYSHECYSYILCNVFSWFETELFWTVLQIGKWVISYNWNNMVTAAFEWCETSPRMSLLVNCCLLGHYDTTESLIWLKVTILICVCRTSKELVYRLAVIGINLELTFTWKSKKLFSTVFFSSLDPFWILVTWEILIEYFDAARSEILTELKITNLMLDVWVKCRSIDVFLSLNRCSSLQAHWSVIATYGGITQHIFTHKDWVLWRLFHCSEFFSFTLSCHLTLEMSSAIIFDRQVEHIT